MLWSYLFLFKQNLPSSHGKHIWWNCETTFLLEGLSFRYNIFIYTCCIYIYILEVLEVYRHPPKRKRLFIKFRSNKNREPNERSRCYHSLSHEVISSYPGGEGSRVPQKAMGKNSHQFFEMHTRISTEVIVTIVSKSVYFTYLGDLQPTYIGVK